MAINIVNQVPSWLDFSGSTLNRASAILVTYGALMWLSCGIVYFLSLSDARTLREVGVWVKPMKFMAATALFAWTTVWLSYLASPSIVNSTSYGWICVLIVTTSLFEVVYITYQGSQGAASHYNTSDSLHAILFGVMALAAVGLTATQAWLAWEIWKEQSSSGLSVVALSVVMGLLLTFILATVSGFLLGGRQPPEGVGLPLVGWHLYRDIRPSHFLGVHAHQLIPLLGLLADRFGGHYAKQAVLSGTATYVVAWMILTWAAIAT